MATKIKDFLSELEGFLHTQDSRQFVIDHPEWNRVNRDFSQRLGIEPPTLIRVPTPFINAAASPHAGKVYVSDGMMKLLNCDHNSAPSPSMQSVLGHELGHMKYDGHIPSRLGIQTSWISLPLAGMLALAFYEQALESPNLSLPQEVKRRQIQGHIDNAIEQTLESERQKAEKAHGNPDHFEWLKHQLYEARYLVIAALGMAGGLWLNRNASNFREFRADQVEAELMGEVESFKELERLFPDAARRVFKEHNPPSKDFAERLEQMFEKSWRRFKHSIFYAHPSSHARIEAVTDHLEQVKRTGKPLHVPDFTPVPAR